MGEFNLIKQYFDKRSVRDDVLQSVGDDCAITTLKANQQLATTTDTLVCGTHFLADISPEDLAYKAIAVNLSDLAAMGAKPAWISLALTLPNIDTLWLNSFSQQLFAILDYYNIALIGGDTTKGPLSITITAQGLLEKNKGLYRHRAKVGDLVYVSGSLGDSAAGLNLLLNQAAPYSHQQQYLIQRHLCPTPRIELGQLLIKYSQCAIDISDGLLADLSHILQRSQCGAEIFVENLPLSSALLADFSQTQAEHFALTGGEDYELCFTIPPDKQAEFEQAIQPLNIDCHCIGRITEHSLVLSKHGKHYPLPNKIGFDHFS